MKPFKAAPLEWVALTVISLAFIWFYAGFYFPDPYSYHRFGNALVSTLVWGTRISFPLLFVLIAYLYYGVKTGRILGKNLLLLLVSLIIAGSLCLVIGAWAYHYKTSAGDGKNKYHPYLQLGPPMIDSSEYRPENYNVFCLGGSTTEYTKKGGPGWPEMVQDSLRRLLGRGNMRFHNLGKEWYTSLHSLINFQTNLRHHRPDLIVVMHSINDLLHNADHSYFSGGPFREDYGHFYGPVSRMVRDRNFLADIFESLRIWYAPNRQELSPDSFPGLEPFRRNLGILLELAASDGIPVVLMTQPSLYKEDMTEAELSSLHMVNVESYGPEFKWGHFTALRGMRAYNETTRTLARERGVHLIDLERSVPASREFFWDDVHYTSRGFDRVASEVFKGLVNLGVSGKGE